MQLMHSVLLQSNRSLAMLKSMSRSCIHPLYLMRQISPSKDLLVKLYIPEMPDDPKNKKLHHFITTSKTLERWLQHIHPFVQGKEEWDPSLTFKAKLCVESMMAQYRKEQKNKEQMKSGDLESHIIPMLNICKEITKLLHQPSSELPWQNHQG